MLEIAVDEASVCGGESRKARNGIGMVQGLAAERHDQRENVNSSLNRAVQMNRTRLTRPFLMTVENSQQPPLLVQAPPHVIKCDDVVETYTSFKATITSECRSSRA